MAVPMTLSDIKEYSLRLNAVLGCNMHSQITVGNVTLPKAVLSTVKIFAVYHPRLYPRKKKCVHKMILKIRGEDGLYRSVPFSWLPHIPGQLSSVGHSIVATALETFVCQPLERAGAVLKGTAWRLGNVKS